MALRSAATLFAALLLVAAAAPALADIEVLSSDVPGLAVGTRLPDGTVLSVPAGRSLRLLGPDGSTTYLVVGPLMASSRTISAACPAAGGRS
ncbi:MAG: hypothetical protein R3D33_03715 [Hyphomicrobiaceae bacterium]